MKIVGAVSESNHSKCIYFCRCNSADLNTDVIIPEQILHALCKEENQDFMIALESDDDLESDKKFVGTMYDTGDYIVHFINKGYEEILDYMEQIFNWEFEERREL